MASWNGPGGLGLIGPIVRGIARACCTTNCRRNCCLKCRYLKFLLGDFLGSYIRTLSLRINFVLSICPPVQPPSQCCLDLVFPWNIDARWYQQAQTNPRRRGSRGCDVVRRTSRRSFHMKTYTRYSCGRRSSSRRSLGPWHNGPAQCSANYGCSSQNMPPICPPSPLSVRAVIAIRHLAGSRASCDRKLQLYFRLSAIADLRIFGFYGRLGRGRGRRRLDPP